MLQVLGDVAVRVLQVMGQHVRMQVGFLVKTLVTPLKAAEEGLLSGVDPQMRLQVEV
jgi:flagellar biosynthesis protein FliR